MGLISEQEAAEMSRNKNVKFNKENMKGEWPGAQYDKAHEVDALIKFAKDGSDVAGKDEL